MSILDDLQRGIDEVSAPKPRELFIYGSVDEVNAKLGSLGGGWIIDKMMAAPDKRHGLQ